MRSSTIITLLGAGLAIASPIVKKALVIEVVTDIVYTTVTETIPPTSDQVTTVSFPVLSATIKRYYFPITVLLPSNFSRQ